MLRPSNILQERKAALVKALSGKDGAGGVQLPFPKCSAENQSQHSRCGLTNRTGKEADPDLGI